ncbi:hypothetical protein LWP59_19960 [Amycolatopsis acidiphila]|uniref:Uncharacterized protein n=1 Tax=Amycolatopsis acidiphila TaxID=715473 RepID=A0A558AG74_9PSEU|nr:hypothetical protein [Amycolatopsis acidiphila]TVT23254.1 hypothetical protein FNH06_10160 [Amycolatopsis acidiphila]UIJ56471.1 hypothetical protein LWP59_19960 [Amycolatopsis acidiphila]GHG67075.1 hypothetical protein GCM10017788_25710 [Amycolatopsis acidiphila]
MAQKLLSRADEREALRESFVDERGLRAEQDQVSPNVLHGWVQCATARFADARCGTATCSPTRCAPEAGRLVRGPAAQPPYGRVMISSRWPFGSAQ